MDTTNTILPTAWPDRGTGAAQLACDGRQIRDTDPAPAPVFIPPDNRKHLPAPEQVCIVFDGPPGPESGRFVEVETLDGRGMRCGKWERHPAICGLWRLVIPAPKACTDSWNPVLAEYDELRQGIDDLCKRLHGWSQHDNNAQDYAADALALVEKADEIRDMLGTAVES